MSNALDVKIISFALTDATSGWVGDDVTGHILKAPSAGNGGGITLLDVSVVNAAATGAGTGFSLQLENWDTAGTAIKSSGGTVAAALGGTSSPWAANTPKSFTISNAFLDAGEWLVLRKAETNSSDPTRAVVTIQYLMGR